MDNFNYKTGKKADGTIKYKGIQFVLFVLLLELMLLPFPGFADVQTESTKKEKNIVFVTPQKEESEKKEKNNSKPAIDSVQKEVAWSERYVMTAYNSEPGQTDDSPCITANGFNVCEHGIEDTVAANFLKFGTEIRIPELFGDKVFVVRDRMNKRYTKRVDVWLLSYDNAIDFGVQYPLIEVLK